MDKNSLEYDFYKQFLLSILTSLSYCYMALRNYTEAQKCLNEALQISEEKIIPTIYFRLAQTRIYNRYSREEGWAIALSDLNKAKRFIENINQCKKTLEDKILEELINKELENIKSLIYNYEEETKYRNNCKFYI